MHTDVLSNSQAPQQRLFGSLYLLAACALGCAILVYAASKGPLWAGSIVSLPIALVVGISVVAGLRYRLAPAVWLLIAAVIVALASSVLTFLAAIVLVASAWMIGCWVLRGRVAGEGDVTYWPINFAIGLAVLSALFSVFLPLPLFRAEFLWPLFTLPFAAACREAARLLSACGGEGRVRVSWVAVSVAMPLALLFAAAMLPLSSFDDLAYHLRLPAQLLNFHRYDMDVSGHQWALAPWSGDLLFGVGQVLAAGDTGVKGWLNLTYLASTAALLWQLMLNLQLRLRYLLLALFLSTPILLALVHTLHTELLTGMYALAAFALLCRTRSTSPKRQSAALGAILGALVATKATAVFMLLPLGFWACWQIVRAPQMRMQRFVLVSLLVAMGAFCGLQSYLWAYVKTGNPVFPLFNGIFLSPLSWPTNFSNALYSGHFDWGLPLRMIVQADTVFETAQKFAGGVHLLAFGLPAFIALVVVRDRLAWAAAVVAGAYLIGVLSAQQYLRYAYPALPFIAIVVAAVVQRMAAFRWLSAAAACLALMFLCSNLAVISALSHVTNVPLFKVLLVPGERNQYLSKMAPERLIASSSRELLGNRNVVFVEADNRPYGAEFTAKVILGTWYNRSVNDEYRDLRDEKQLFNLFERYGVTHVLLPHEGLMTEHTRWLAGALAGKVEPVIIENGAQLLRLKPGLRPSALRPELDASNTAWAVSGAPQWLPEGGGVRLPKGSLVYQSFPLRSEEVLQLSQTVRCLPGSQLLTQLNWTHGPETIGSDYRQTVCSNPITKLNIDIKIPRAATGAVLYFSNPFSENIDVLSGDLTVLR